MCLERAESYPLEGPFIDDGRDRKPAMEASAAPDCTPRLIGNQPGEHNRWSHKGYLNVVRGLFVHSESFRSVHPVAFNAVMCHRTRGYGQQERRKEVIR